MSQKQKLCDFCKKPIKWPENYQKGMKPVNLDDSVHDCRDRSESNKSPVQSTMTPNFGVEETIPETAEKSIQIKASKGVKIIITIEVIPDA